jgi:hypothetical protein
MRPLKGHKTAKGKSDPVAPISLGVAPPQGAALLPPFKKMPTRFYTDSAMNVAGPLDIVLDQKCNPSKHSLSGGRTYYGTGHDWRSDNRYRWVSYQWFPVGTVLVCLHRIDTDCWIVDPQRTISKNGFSQDWLDDNEPGDAVTIPLF